MTGDLRELTIRFLRGESTADENVALVRGVLRETAESSAPPAGSGGSYAGMLDRLAARLPEMERDVAREIEAELSLADRLESASEAAVAAVVREAGRARAEHAFEELCARSQQACSRDPHRALVLAEAALRTATAIGALGAIAFDLEARAAARIANAQRVSGDFPAAASAMLSAGERLEAGLGSPLARADVALRQAALLADQSRFAEALKQSRRAARWFAAAGEATEELRALLQQSNILRELDRLPEALAVLEGAASRRCDPTDRRLEFAIATNRACYLAELGRHAEAEAGLHQARGLAAVLGNALDAPRVDWVESVLRAEQGRLEEAEALLRRVRARYLELGLAHDVALATLELALVVARRGAFAEAHRLALEALPTFEALRVSPEAVAALRLALDTARGEAMRVELLRSAVKRLRR